jgi:hypothetical protein
MEKEYALVFKIGHVGIDYGFEAQQKTARCTKGGKVGESRLQLG